MDTHSKGFTLLEIAIIIGLSSLIIGAALGILRSQVAKSTHETTKSHMAEIQQALADFQMKHNRLPCPAPLHAVPTDPAFGKEISDTCASAALLDTKDVGDVRIGALPVLTLDLPANHITDDWGRRFVYGVSEKLADKTIKYNAANGAVSMKDRAGNIQSQVPFVVISLGRDGRGGISREGKDMQPCPVLGPQAENCDMNNATFVSTDYADSEADTSRFTHFVLSNTGLSPVAICGSKGMVYGPTHPQRDTEGCVTTATVTDDGNLQVSEAPDADCNNAAQGTTRYDKTCKRLEVCNGAKWEGIGNGTVKPFSFSNQSNLPLNGTANSNAVVLDNTPCTKSSARWVATCGSGCTAIARNGVWGGTSVSGFKKGDTIAIRQNTSTNANTTTSASVTVGTTTSAPWNVTTTAVVGFTCPSWTAAASIQVLSRPAYRYCWARCGGSWGYSRCPGACDVGWPGCRYSPSAFCHSGICTAWVANWPITFLSEPLSSPLPIMSWGPPP